MALLLAHDSSTPDLNDLRADLCELLELTHGVLSPQDYADLFLTYARLLSSLTDGY